MSAPRDVAVTGLGAVSALGDDVKSLWSAIVAGHCGIDVITRFSTAPFGVATAAVVPGAESSTPWARADAERLCIEFAVRAGREALCDAGIAGAVAPERIALVLGTGLNELERPIDHVVESIAAELGVAGPCITVSTACSSSTGAIGMARDVLAMDAADVVLAGGVDVLSPEVFAGFHALGVLAARRCAPFSMDTGTTLGEGAGFLVLERIDSARARGARTRVVLQGYGLSADGWHETSPDPKGEGVERAIRSALSDAGVGAPSVEYVNAHGSGTTANDLSEWIGIQRALGEHARAIPVSSTKGALGHTQGAAGALESIVTIVAMERDVVPPTLNLDAPRPHGPSDPVPGPTPRPGRVDRALSLNSAFGGANCALVFGRESLGQARQRRALVLRGAGCVGQDGERASSVDFRSVVPDADSRGLDPSARYLAMAVALALRDAGIPIRGALRGCAGLMVGQRRASPTSLRTFYESIAARGMGQLSATAFARIVLNAAAGACTKLHEMRGPLSVLTTGSGSGFTAVVMAAELLSVRDDVALIVAGGVDERPAPGGWIQDVIPADGAACVVLTAEGSDVPSGTRPVVMLSDWALAAAGRIDDAIAQLSSHHAFGSARVIRLDDPCGGASSAVSQLARSMRDIESGAVRAVVVAEGSGRSVSSAVLLTASPA